VDGGGTNNQLMMQFQADMINVPVVKPKVMETTSMGAAFGAGLAVGVWKDLNEIRELWSEAERFQPAMDPIVREKNWAGWKKAITRSLGWIGDEDDEDEEEQFVDAKQGGDDLDVAIDGSEKNAFSPSGKRGISTAFGFFSAFSFGILCLGTGYLLGKNQRLRRH
jgi:hypothetical protein